ncbi:MAG: sigma-54-dependent Fis family transcriptional regulator [Nitrospirae bacterium]|nr:sigma-54-dependent Fis family transcriptional regulator [Nitrospirota bacterium]
MRLLIVDDEDESRRLIRSAIEGIPVDPREIEEAASGEEAAARLAQAPFDIVLTDMVMDRMDGLKVLKAAKDARTETEVILVTAYATIESAVKAIKAGAFDYISKPVHAEEVQQVVLRILERQNLLRELERFRDEVESRSTIDRIIGDSTPIRQLKKMIQSVAEADAHILITGETGTGKELVARALHSLSKRKARPIVAVNCAALPENLLESELFGYRRGAFTGAGADKRGLIEEAHGSTLFLDEIGEMPLTLQAKLLRALDTGEYRRLGDVKAHHVDVRVVAATNIHVERAIREGKFREDLFYRLSVFHVVLPPLRERVEDIPLLVQHYVREFAEKFGKRTEGVKPDGLRYLSRLRWDGNVRELSHVIERAVVLSQGTMIPIEDLSQIVGDRAEAAEPILPLHQVEKNCILEALQRCGGQKEKTAQVLGISTATLWRKLKEYGISAQAAGRAARAANERDGSSE